MGLTERTLYGEESSRKTDRSTTDGKRRTFGRVEHPRREDVGNLVGEKEKRRGSTRRTGGNQETFEAQNTDTKVSSEVRDWEGKCERTVILKLLINNPWTLHFTWVDLTGRCLSGYTSSTGDPRHPSDGRREEVVGERREETVGSE